MTDYATTVRVHGDQVLPERNPGPWRWRAGRLPICSTRPAPELSGDRPGVVVAGLVDRTGADRESGGGVRGGRLPWWSAHPDAALQERRMATEKVTPHSDLFCNQCDKVRVNLAATAEQIA